MPDDDTLRRLALEHDLAVRIIREYLDQHAIAIIRNSEAAARGLLAELARHGMTIETTKETP